MSVVHKTKQGSFIFFLFFFLFYFILFFFLFFVHGVIRKGRPFAVVSSGSHSHWNLGKILFPRGRSEIQGWKLGQKGPPSDSCLYGITSGLDVSRQRPCIWIMLYMSAVLFVLLFIHSSTDHILPVRPLKHIPRWFLHVDNPPAQIWLFSPAACLDTRVRRSSTGNRSTRADTFHPPKNSEPSFRRVYAFLQTLLCCGAFHHARRVLFTQKPKGAADASVGARWGK